LARAEGIHGPLGRRAHQRTRRALREPFYLLELDGEDFRPIPLARPQWEAPTPDNMLAATTGSPQ
jgi:hypothetical protein